MAASLGLRWSGHAVLASTWTDRDLWRAARLAQDWPTSGAELSFGTGGRVPGPLLYLLLALPLRFSPEAIDVFRFQTALDALGLLVLARAAQRLGGAVAAAVAVAVVVLSDVAIDATWHLWNPGLLPLFCAAGWALALRAPALGGRALVGSAIAFALAAQLHLSAWLSLIAILAAAVLLRLPGAVRGLAGALVAVVVLQLPYLLDEALHGWPNTTALLTGPQQVRATGRLGLGGLVDVVGPLVTPSVDRLAHQLGAAPLRTAATLLLHATGLVVAVGVAARGRARGRALVLPLAAIVATLAFFVLEGHVDLAAGLAGKQRYLVPVLPAWGLLVGVGVARLVVAVGSRAGRWAGDALVVLLAAGLVAEASLAVDALEQRATRPELLRRQPALLAEVRAATGWTLEEVVGRTVAAGAVDDRRVTGMVELPVGYALLRAGARWPGSLPPPCAVLVLGGHPPAFDAALVEAAVRRPLPDVDVVGTDPLPGGGTLVRYTTSDALCPTNLTAVYVGPADDPVPLDAAAPPVDHPSDLVAPATGVRRQLATVPLVAHGEQTDLLLAVDLDAGRCPGTLRLDSRRLRGESWNLGPLRPAVLDDPVLDLVRADGTTVTLDLHVSRLGSRGAVSPVTVALPPEAGPFDVRLRAGTRMSFPEHVDEAAPAEPVAATIFRGATLPCPAAP